MARYVDIENNEKIVNAMYELFRTCNFRHKEGCLAPNCKECIKRFFGEQYLHLLPTASNTETRHGKWEIVKGVVTPGGDPLKRCPFCKSKESEHLDGVEHRSRWSFCPICGAVLDNI